MLIENSPRALPRRLIAGLSALALLATQMPLTGFAQEPPPPAATNLPPTPQPSEPGPAPGKATQKQLEQLVSPIALYPDLLVAQILAASTYPTQIVEADRWLHDNQNLKGTQLTEAASQQPWDPSVKSLTQYAPVLDNMSKNLSWTSALGQAYYNQPADVMSAIQTLRHMAQKAGTLQTTPQQKVVVENAAGGTSAAPTTVTEGTSGNTTIIIEPAQPQIVYVPEYNPTTAYGQPVPPPPGYSSEDLLMTGLLAFGVGMLVGDMIGSSSNSWGCNWHGGNVVYNHNVYVSNSNAIPSRWGYHGYPPPNHPYYGYGPGRYGYNNYPRPYSEPAMPRQYDQPQYRPEQTAMNHPADQGGWQNNRNAAPNGMSRPAADNNFRGYGDQEHPPSNHTWGGNAQPGGFTQAASSRGRDSYNGTNNRWGNGRLIGNRHF